MHLNHLNLPVSDVAVARSFFQDMFGFTTVRAGGDALAILDDGHGTTLVLMNGGRMNAAQDGNEPPDYPAGFHVGFIVASRAEVDAAHARLAAAGHPLDHAPRRQHGSYGFYVKALDGILIEVATTAP